MRTVRHWGWATGFGAAMAVATCQVLGCGGDEISTSDRGSLSRRNRGEGSHGARIVDGSSFRDPPHPASGTTENPDKTGLSSAWDGGDAGDDSIAEASGDETAGDEATPPTSDDSTPIDDDAGDTSDRADLDAPASADGSTDDGDAETSTTNVVSMDNPQPSNGSSGSNPTPGSASSGANSNSGSGSAGGSSGSVFYDGSSSGSSTGPAGRPADASADGTVASNASDAGPGSDAEGDVGIPRGDGGADSSDSEETMADAATDSLDDGDAGDLQDTADGVASTSSIVLAIQGEDCLACAQSEDSGTSCLAAYSCEGLAGGFSEVGVPKEQLCQEALSCELKTSCQSVTTIGCYCGSSATFACEHEAGAAAGPCVPQEQAGLETTDPFQITVLRWHKPAFAAGMANQLVGCLLAHHCNCFNPK
jgi:hypothetical protein